MRSAGCLLGNPVEALYEVDSGNSLNPHYVVLCYVPQVELLNQRFTFYTMCLHMLFNLVFCILFFFHKFRTWSSISFLEFYALSFKICDLKFSSISVFELSSFPQIVYLCMSCVSSYALQCIFLYNFLLYLNFRAQNCPRRIQCFLIFHRDLPVYSHKLQSYTV